MNPRLLIPILILFQHVAAGPIAASRRDAVVKVVSLLPDGTQRSGSGVCVDRTGVVLTVSHVVRRGNCRVYFGKSGYVADRVVVPEQEGVAVLLVQSERRFPYLEIARTRPQVGDDVWVMGFPEGRWYSFGTRVSTHELYFADEPSTKLTGVAHPVGFGTSGGPLVTAEWKVAGIASVSGRVPPPQSGGRRLRETVRVAGAALDRTGGMYLALEHVQAAYAEFLSLAGTQRSTTADRKPVLYAFTTANCDACRQFKRDYQRGQFRQFEVRLIEDGRNEWATAAAEVRRATGGPLPQTVPFFWVQGSRQVVQQRSYHAPGLLQLLAAIVEGLGKLIFNPQAEQPPLPPSLGEPEPLPERPELIPGSAEDREAEQGIIADWSEVTVIVLVARQDVGAIRGRLRKTALAISAGPLKRRLAEATEGQATIEVVSERLEERRFAAVSEAAGVRPDPLAVVVLVGRQDLGLFKSLIVKKLETVLIGKLQDAPVDVIFERVHPDDYAAIKDALRVSGAAEFPSDQPGSDRRRRREAPWGPREVTPALAVAWLAERLVTKLRKRLRERREI